MVTPGTPSGRRGEASAGQRDRTAVPRRKDRAVEDEAWVRDYLARAAYGTLAMVHDGKPAVNINLFAYDPASHSVVFHTARLGHTREVAERGGGATFVVGEMGRLLPANTALEFSVEYASVVANGRIEIIQDPEEQRRLLHLILDKYAPHLQRGRDYADATAHDLGRTSVFRLRIESWTAKRKVAAADHPGAFRYGEVPSYRGPLADES